MNVVGYKGMEKGLRRSERSRFYMNVVGYKVRC